MKYAVIMQLLVVMPLTIIGTYLLYVHVNAPQAVWLLWIVSSTVSVISSIIAGLLDESRFKSGVNKEVAKQISAVMEGKR